MSINKIKATVRKCGCIGYSAVGKMEDYYSEVQGFEIVSATFPFVDMKISSQHHPAWCSRAIATRVGLCSCVLWG